MNKDQLKKEQPIVYRTLSNALKKNKYAHAYLFYGPKGSLKEEAALLFAQSLVCQHTDEDGFACQTCDACRRIEKEESIDFFYLGKNEKIKKKCIVDLQEALKTTAAEKENCQTYILDHFDQASVESSNSLLKFLEEPAPGIVGILIADEKNKILPTIQSRCQSISFRPASIETRKRLFSKEMEEESADMLAWNGYTPNQVEEIIQEKDIFDLIRKESFEYMEHWKEHRAIVRMQTRVFPSKGKNTTSFWIRIWIEWILYYMRNKNLEISFDQKIKIQNILIEAQDRLYRPVDLGLFLDHTYEQIRKAVLE